MGQVVRKNIAEKHPELNEKKTYTLLIDGNALLRRSFKCDKVNSEGVHYGGVFEFLLQMRMLLQKKVYDYIYVTFDGHGSGYLRYIEYNDYKANRDKNYADFVAEKSDYWKEYEKTLKKMQTAIYSKKQGKESKETTEKKAKTLWLTNNLKYEVQESKSYPNTLYANFNGWHFSYTRNTYPLYVHFTAPDDTKGSFQLYRTKDEQDVDENFARERDILLTYFNELFVRWFFDDEDVTEGDDIIAYYVKNKKKEDNVVIVTGDRDLGQLVSDSVCIYDLNTKKYISNAKFSEYMGVLPENVATKKILLGDDSDNIKGIYGLSESRLKELAPEMDKKPITVEEIRKRAQKGIDKRIEEKKKPYKWQENVVNGVSNGNYNGDFYEINRKIIDLKNPMLSEKTEQEIKNMMYNVQDPEGRSFENLYKMMREDGIDDFIDSNKFASFFEPFKEYVDKEIRNFKKNGN